MADTVSRNALLQCFPGCGQRWWPDQIRRKINSAPNDTCTFSEDQDFEGSLWTCSECGCVVGYSGEPPYKFCPICGREIECYIGYDDPSNPNYEDLDAPERVGKVERDG